MPSDLQPLSLEQRAAIADLCARLRVERLHLFGSVLTSRFDPAHSDVDFLVEFFDSDQPGIADRFLALAEGLEGVLGRPVDLLTPPSLQNPVFRRVVEQTRHLLYAA